MARISKPARRTARRFRRAQPPQWRDWAAGGGRSSRMASRVAAPGHVIAESRPSGPVRVTAGAGRDADRALRVGAGVAHAVARELIEGRRLHGRVPRATEQATGPLVGGHEQDVRSVGLCVCHSLPQLRTTPPQSGAICSRRCPRTLSIMRRAVAGSGAASPRDRRPGLPTGRGRRRARGSATRRSAA